jgi:hypothetical protein
MAAPSIATAGALHRHAAYGLSVDSTFALPALAGRRADDDSAADVLVRAAPLPDVPDGATDLGAGHWACGETVWLSFDGACRLYVRAGREIVVEGAPGADDGVLRLFVQGVGLGVLLQQRGMLSLHAGAAAVHGVAVAFLGAPGSGKSTMTAALRRRGHRVMADDVVPVDLSDPARPVVAAGFPQLKLSPAAAAAVGEDVDALVRLHHGNPKLGCPVHDAMADGWLPLARVYILAEDATLGIDALAPQAALVELIRHTYAAGLLESSGAMATHLRQCAALVAAVRVCRLRRPLSFEMLPAVAELVESDCATGGR